jgi:DNA repair protein RecO (recombination protein O)
MNAPEKIAPRIDRQRVDLEAGFVLHTYPWRETSLLVEAFTRHHGRVALIARGARRPASQLRGLMMPFTPLLFSWSGKGELRTLIRAEWRGGLAQPAGRALMCGFYVNELLLKLLAREDAHEILFDDYAQTLGAFDAGCVLEVELRRFEARLLASLGYAQPFAFEAGGDTPVEPDRDYMFVPGQGAWPTDAERQGAPVRGAVLLALAEHDAADARLLTEAKPLMRALIDHYLGDAALYSRGMLKELQAL